MEGYRMTPRTEFRDFLARSRRLFNAVLLLLITFALLVVAAGTLFCTIWITAFTVSRNTVDRWTTRVTAEKGAALDALQA